MGLLVLAGGPLVAEGPVDAWAFRLDAAQAKLPAQEERLGLAGLSLLMETPSGFYLGPALQAALRGERGGFFAGGLEGGLRVPLASSLALDGGVFLGGGGGGGAPVGGGLMVRPRLGLQWEGATQRLGFGLAYLDFPNGSIHSAQVYVSWERTFASLRFQDGDRGGSLWAGAPPWHLERQFVELHASRYAPSGAGPGAIDLGGFTWGRTVGGPFCFLVEASAAARGAASGYMEVLAGLGGRFYLDPGRRLALRGALEAGSGGGGYTGTGGGFLVKESGGLQFQLTPAAYLFAEAGRVEAPSSPFRETVFSVGTGFTLGSLAPGAGPDQPGEGLSALRWRLSSGFQVLGRVARTTGPDAALEQYVFRAEAQLSDHVYLTGQSGWAVGGQVGAWATGMLGVGAQTADHDGHRLRVEVAGGAGGGGGVASSGGGLVQGLAGWNWDWSPSWSLHLMAGTVRGIHGGLSSPVLELGVGFRGARPVVFLPGP
jgi:hypothetical protein